MKNYGLKMRERYEQKEYYPDKYGETRVDRMNNRKQEKYKKLMRKTIKENENNG